MGTRAGRPVVALITFGLLLATNIVCGQEPKALSSEELAKGTIHRRAVDAAIWGVPAVSFDAMRQADLRDGKAKYNDIIWWPKQADCTVQVLTPNTTVRYVYVFTNTKEDGPVVLNLPAAVGGASFFGTFCDAWLGSAA